MSAKSILIGLLLAASVCGPVAVRLFCRQAEQGESARLREQGERLASLSAENQRLSALAAKTQGPLSDEQLAELLRLRNEVGQLHQAAKKAEQLRSDAQVPPVQPGQPPAFPPPPAETVLAFWPQSELASAGYADPVSALKTALWAMNRADGEALAQSVTPEARSTLARERWNQHGTPEEELAKSATQIAASLKPSAGFYVVGQNQLTENDAVLAVYFDGEGKTRKFALQKLGGEWKVSGLGRAGGSDKALLNGDTVWP